jgi:drug/metabolite transporter (DMT)-like permease
VIGLRRAKESLIGSNHLMLLLRGLFGTTALFCFFLTVQQIPLAPAQTIQYLSPIFTTTLAIFVLKEPVKPAQWIFYVIAFSGVLLIQQFDSRSRRFIWAWHIFGVLFGKAYNLVRSMRGREYPLTIVLHFQLTGAVVGLISLLFQWETPTGWDWLFYF